VPKDATLHSQRQCGGQIERALGIPKETSGFLVRSLGLLFFFLLAMGSALSFGFRLFPSRRASAKVAGVNLAPLSPGNKNYSKLRRLLLCNEHAGRGPF